MKVFLKKLLLFAFSAFAIYILLLGTLYFIRIGNVPMIFRTTQGNVFKGGLTYKKFQDFDKNKKYDIIVLGSSHAYRGYDPQIFDSYGYDIYNLGSSAQGILASYIIARHFIKKENCNTVIIDLYDRIFKINSIESLSDITQNVSSDKAALDLCLHSKDLRAINMITLRMFNKMDPPLNKDTSDIDRGFQASKSQLILPGVPKDVDYVTNEKTLAYFAKLIHYLHHEGLQVILAEHPLPAVYTIPDFKHEAFIRDIRKITDQYQIPWYDLMKDSTMSGIQYYADENHLNYRGVIKYNHKLIGLMQQEGILKKKNK